METAKVKRPLILKLNQAGVEILNAKINFVPGQYVLLHNYMTIVSSLSEINWPIVVNLLSVSYLTL